MTPSLKTPDLFTSHHQRANATGVFTYFIRQKFCNPAELIHKGAEEL
jgi:hypothetical protein